MEVCASWPPPPPARAITEPEERSILAVMITWVTPTAMMPIIATCSTISTSRLVLRRERLVAVQPAGDFRGQGNTSITTEMPVSFGFYAT